jgi:hypothetical protein
MAYCRRWARALLAPQVIEKASKARRERGAWRMTSTSLRIGSWVVLAALVLLLVLAIAFMLIGWDTADAGMPMTTAGYMAMTFGIVATLALGSGLMALVFYSSRKGHD